MTGAFTDLALDLSPKAVRARVERKQTIDRALARAERLERKAARLPIGNGKRKALARAQFLRAMAR